MYLTILVITFWHKTYYLNHFSPAQTILIPSRRYLQSENNKKMQPCCWLHLILICNSAIWHKKCDTYVKNRFRSILNISIKCICKVKCEHHSTFDDNSLFASIANVTCEQAFKCRRIKNNQSEKVIGSWKDLLIVSGCGLNVFNHVGIFQMFWWTKIRLAQNQTPVHNFNILQFLNSCSGKTNCVPIISYFSFKVLENQNCKYLL